MTSLPSTHWSILNALGDPEEGDQAFKRFERRYRGAILQRCLQRGLKYDRAEDVTQNVLLKVWRSWNTFDPACGAFRPWLATVIRNALTDQFHALAREPKPASDPHVQHLLEQLQDPQLAEDMTTTVEDGMRRDLKTALARVETRVEKQSWQAFYQTMVEERPVREVSQALGMSTGAVYQIRHRLSKMVARELELLQAEQQDS